MKYFVFFAPEMRKYRHIDFCRSFKTMKAAKKFVDDDVLFFKKQGEKRWPKSSYFIAKRVQERKRK